MKLEVAKSQMAVLFAARGPTQSLQTLCMVTKVHINLISRMQVLANKSDSSYLTKQTCKLPIHSRAFLADSLSRLEAL